ncbi:hypothetical protein MMC28_002555 [Mycoblastus sanguinarius]|nr:hypothetical protein [Mycoblastus sanguinarius]
MSSTLGRLLVLVTVLGRISLVLSSLATSDLLPRTCGTIVTTKDLYQIYEGAPNVNSPTGPILPGPVYAFQASQGNESYSEEDLVVSFQNVLCPPAGSDPYTIEFDFQLGMDYSTNGNTKLSLFPIRGVLPIQGGAQVPTWKNVGPLTGSQIAILSLPAADTPQAEKANIYHIVNVTCSSEINLRFSIEKGTPPADNGGYVSYDQANETGIRLRYGC